MKTWSTISSTIPSGSSPLIRTYCRSMSVPTPAMRGVSAATGISPRTAARRSTSSMGGVVGSARNGFIALASSGLRTISAIRPRAAAPEGPTRSAAIWRSTARIPSRRSPESGGTTISGAEYSRAATTSCTLLDQCRYSVALPAPARAATASIVIAAKPCSSSSSSTARQMASRSSSPRRRRRPGVTTSLSTSSTLGTLNPTLRFGRNSGIFYLRRWVSYSRPPVSLGARDHYVEGMPPPPSSAAGPGPTHTGPWLVPLLVLVFGMFMSLLDTTIVNVAIPRMQADFGVTTTDIQWIATAYTLTLGVVVPLSGWLGDRFGHARVYIWSMLGFAATSALCGLAWNLGSMIAFRILQAAPGGILPVVAMAMLYRIVPREKMGMAMGIFGIGVSFAPALGPTLGGYLVEYVDWRLIFYI